MANSSDFASNLKMSSDKREISLVDLPESMDVGRLPLIPSGISGRILTPCDDCKLVSTRQLLASCGHTFCRSCCATRREFGEGLRLSCVICRRECACQSVDLPDSVLKDMTFAYRCGMKGSLMEIKDHICTWADQASDHDEQWETVDHGTGRRLTMAVPNVTQKSMSRKKFVRVNLAEIIDFHKHTKAHEASKQVRLDSEGYEFDFFCEIRTVDSQQVLSVWILNLSSDQQAEDAWPVKKKIHIQMYSNTGRVLKEVHWFTFKNGKPISKLFEENGSRTTHGSIIFYSVDTIVACRDHILRDGAALFSVEFSPL